MEQPVAFSIGLVLVLAGLVIAVKAIRAAVKLLMLAVIASGIYLIFVRGL